MKNLIVDFINTHPIVTETPTFETPTQHVSTQSPTTRIPTQHVSTQSPTTVTPTQTPYTCEDGYMRVVFSQVSGEDRCFVRLSDESLKTDGLMLIEQLTSSSSDSCLNPGYYLIGCDGPGVISVGYLNDVLEHYLDYVPYYKVLLFNQVE